MIGTASEYQLLLVYARVSLTCAWPGEHSIMYEYGLANAQNHYMGFIQTESVSLNDMSMKCALTGASTPSRISNLTRRPQTRSNRARRTTTLRPGRPMLLGVFT